jgi:hypothetical protein
MREVLSLFMFGIGALFFVVFFTVLKPDAEAPVAGAESPVHATVRMSRLSQSE